MPTKSSTALYPSYPFTSSRRAAIAQIAATVIQAARESDIDGRSIRAEFGFGAHILSRMAATSQELALRYLLELSKDIRGALLLEPGGALIAAAPDPHVEGLADLAAELSREVGVHFGPAGEAVELDASCEGGSVFLVRSSEVAMVCVTERSVLPGLIFYDMHAVLSDLGRAAAAEARRVGETSNGRPAETAASEKADGR